MGNLDVVCFGEVLWDQIGEERRVGGAPMNVCYHLSKLGIPTSMVSQIGADGDGSRMLEELGRLGIDVGNCTISKIWPTSVVKVGLEGTDKVVYEIVEDVAWDHIEYTPELQSLVQESKILIYGSLAARSRTTQATLFELLALGTFNVFDVNLRSPFYTEELVLSLLGHADVLKLNEEELRQIAIWLMGDYREMGAAIESLQKTFPRIKEIILTCGGDGAYHISGNSWKRILPYRVLVTDTIGSGDAFLAAFIGLKIRGENLSNGLQKASMLSAFVATCKGACPDYSWEELEGRQWSVPE